MYMYIDHMPRGPEENLSWTFKEVHSNCRTSKIAYEKIQLNLEVSRVIHLTFRMDENQYWLAMLYASLFMSDQSMISSIS